MPENSGANDMSSTTGADTERRSKGLVPFGTWGGVHIRMIVSAEGANIEYDCARGEIAGKLRLDSKGRFELTGTHMREGPGPTRVGKAPSRPARFVGEIDGKEMSLTVTLTDTSEEIGTFKLTRGSEGFIRKCR